MIDPRMVQNASVPLVEAVHLLLIRSQWHDAPEVAPHQSLPEVYYPAAPVPVAQYRRENFSSIPLKPFNSSNDAATFIQSPCESYPGTSTIRTYDNESIPDALPPAEQAKESSKRLCASSDLVSILTAIIAFLFIAVVGLAAGTGVLNNKVKGAEQKLAVPANNTIIDRGCSANPDSVTATRFTSQCKLRILEDVGAGVG